MTALPARPSGYHDVFQALKVVSWDGPAWFSRSHGGGGLSPQFFQ